ncbi:uncharacterized protein Z519_01816 [Cladophialophora bantiana CBS 173.52]|uniref:3-oxoacyl-[acyl-carrier protein] reductase n=1 Tax=Cladophialophora bantiana (strain ATCC 10958 / CBS 173.52 / CDC B-1940 / NIH 8579) TaxID=1442370 RepID=A0A0D2GIM1_CLAB1|nr:uncharacterized protein Z519_01816 [Cladophialophora bantiana CBS 173.52]KIW98232.1 hypothetical protein Z519_01816 [Cladophialophora bantiana CBS 173.52]
MSRLEGKIIAVTGAGAGFGRAIVQKLIAEGAKVLGIDLIASNNEETASLCPNGTFFQLTADVAAEETWQNVLRLSNEHFGHAPTVIVNCAGVVHLGQEPHLVSECEFDNVFKVNVKPLYLSTKVIVPFWIENKIEGHFINIGSISQARPRPTTVWYAGSKGAVTAVTRGLAAAYAKHRIRFNVIRPSIGETAMSVMQTDLLNTKNCADLSIGFLGYKVAKTLQKDGQSD